jgi:hypothetical protein
LRYIAALYWGLNALVNNNYANPHTKLQLAYSFIISLLGIFFGAMLAARVMRYAQLKGRMENKFHRALQSTSLQMSQMRVEPATQQVGLI